MEDPETSPISPSPTSLSALHSATVHMCVALMGPGARDTMAGKALIRGLERAIRDMDETALRVNLTEIRDRLDAALHVPETVAFGAPIPLDATAWDDASNDESAIFAGE